VAEIFSIKSEEIFQPGKQSVKVKPRSLLYYWPAVSMSARREERIASENGYSLIDK